MKKRVPHKCEAFEGEFSIGKKKITAESYVKDHLKFYNIYSSIASKILNIKNTGEFLEVGAGGAFLASIIAKKNKNVNITATDISSEMVSLGTQYIQENKLSNRINYIQSNGKDISFSDKHFDMIYSSFSFNYWKNLPETIINLYSHLKPGGSMFIMDFRRVWWIHLIPEIIWRDVPVILAGYSTKELSNLLDKSIDFKYNIKKISPLSQAIIITKDL